MRKHSPSDLVFFMLCESSHTKEREMIPTITTVAEHNAISTETKRSQIFVPKNIAVKCPQCKDILYERDYQRNLKVCSHCGYHFKLSAHERIEMLVDAGSFVEVDSDITSADPLNFVSQSQVYADKLEKERQKVHMNEAVVIGHAAIDNFPFALAVMDFR